MSPFAHLLCIRVFATLFVANSALAADDFPPEVSVCIEAAQKSATTAQGRGIRKDRVERALQQQIAECTTDAKLTKAQNACVGTINYDYTQLAQAMVSGSVTPLEYVRRVQNRTDKMNRCLKDKSWAAALVRGDKDSDLVPDEKDRCPNTKPFEPTDDFGCPLNRQETSTGPSAEEVQVLLRRMGYVADARCKGAPSPTTPAPISLSYLSLSPIPSRLEVEFGRVKNQPTECGVLYEVLIHGENLRTTTEDLIVLRFAFRASDDTENPPLPDSIKVTKVFTDGAAIAHPNLRWKVRAVNGNGLVSPWSELQKGNYFIS